MNLVLFGPPGAGKGTQSAYLVDKLKLKHISTGDLFRSAMKHSTSLGLEVKKYMDQGKLVPDSVTISMVEEALSTLNNSGFILDGFPRNVSQAEALMDILNRLNKKLNFAVFLEVPSSALVSRLSGRRICRACGAVYHITNNPPKDGKNCDKCGGADIYQRADDEAKAIETRLVVYDESTKPLKKFYQSQGLLTEVSGEGQVAEISQRILAALGQ